MNMAIVVYYSHIANSNQSSHLSNHTFSINSLFEESTIHHRIPNRKESPTTVGTQPFFQ